MQELNCPNLKIYLNLLNESDAVRQESERRMTVSISRFFRDRKLWHDLEQDILPRMIETEKKIFQVWSAGCARGEEVYSFKIVWDRFIGKYDQHSFKIIWDRFIVKNDQQPDLEIKATDIHPDYIEKAVAGLYTKSSLKEVPRKIIEGYFDMGKSGNRFEVKAFLKKDIDWKVQDIFADPPGPEFDIIFLRNNLLTYYKAHKKKEGFNKVIKVLAPDGWLIVGSHEKLPPGVLNIQRHDSIPWAYRQEV
jgi:chemotaxis methyl-accepting protein methylase